MLPLSNRRTWDSGGGDRSERNFIIKGMGFMTIFMVAERR